MRRALPRLAFVTLAALTGPLAAAQTTTLGGTLPLVSVGQGWPQTQETYVIRVAPGDAGKPLGLEVYSPSFNLADADGRRGPGYLGDETGRRGEPFETTFALSGPGGVIIERRFAANREHAWESLFAGGVPAGTYTLRVSSRGDGKNAFALRVAAPFALEATAFSAAARGNVSSPVLVARLNVTSAWVGRPLDISNYDLDGPREVETWAVLPGGRRVNLTPSANGQSATDRFNVTADQLGEWQVFLRVPPTTRQPSNALRYAFRLGGTLVRAEVGGFTPPRGARLQGRLLVDVVDPQGRPIPGASYAVVGDSVVRPTLPPGYVPVGSTLLEGTGNVVSPTEVRFRPGYTRVRFVARSPQGFLTVEAVAVYGRERLPLSGISFQVAGRSFTTPVNVALAPGDYPVTPTPLPGSSVTPLPAARVVDNGAGRVTIEYRVRPEVSLVTFPDVVDTCGVTQLTATARTEFPYRLPGRLRLTLPGGWVSDGPLQLSGDLSASAPLRLRVPVRVCRSDTAEVILDPFDLRTTGQARVRNPGGANVTRTVQGGGRAALGKTVEPGVRGFTVTLTLSVDTTLENVRVIDPLPAGGGTPAVRGPVSVQGPSLASVTPRVEGEAIVLARVIPGTYTLTYPLFTDLPADRVVTTPDLSW
ncbi:hypothetical protein DAETH_22100 [Deinococcus aetherius]|uniref:Carboxypeptidase regulatory-like domain-containing protein n=1 Tax=Deinococcus aetherius TaxID=200252 RepID=A0ABN6RFV3_9DEIO|nr:hypothetical protein [Deinococcus aetherius]BDP42241.1 hypothetical protein DAETH_22100 [Deinococcus aetherius]